MRWLRHALLWSVIASLTMGLASAADAHYRSHADPRDTPDGIDIERTRMRRDRGDIVVKVATYDALPGWGWVFVDFVSRGGPRRDRVAVLQWDAASGGWVKHALYRRGHRFVGSVTARMGEDVLRLRFPKAWLKATRHVRWRVRTAFGYGGTIVDRAPDGGWFAH